MSRKIDRTLCIYCGSNKEVTNDHIPPKCLFRERNKLQLITVPACRKCNESYKKDDEYFRVLVSGDISRNEQGTRLWNEKVMRSTIPRSPKLRAKLVSNLHKVDIETAQGEILKDANVLLMDARRINKVLERIVKGLYWHHYNKCLPPDSSFEIYYKPPIDGELEKILLRTKFSAIGKEEFKYRYNICHDDDKVSLWAFSFFMGIHFLTFTNHQNPLSVHIHKNKA